MLKNSNKLDLTSSNDISSRWLLKKIGCIPINSGISGDFLKELYDTFDICTNKFEELCDTLKKWELDFAKSEEAQPLGAVRFGMRDKRPKSKTKDQKYYIQFGLEYFEWVLDNHEAELKASPDLHKLFTMLQQVDIEAEKIFTEQSRVLLGGFKDKRNTLTYSYKGKPRIPVSLRLLCYEESGVCNTRPHYDKAAFGLLFSSDDKRDAECLLVSPADNSEFSLDKLKQVERPQVNDSTESTAVLIAGSLLEHLDMPVAPTAHLVLPHKQRLRHVLVAFCNVPELNPELSRMDCNIMTKDCISQEFVNRFKM